jgi:hypothetical protein
MAKLPIMPSCQIEHVRHRHRSATLRRECVNCHPRPGHHSMSGTIPATSSHSQIGLGINTGAGFATFKVRPMNDSNLGKFQTTQKMACCKRSAYITTFHHVFTHVLTDFGLRWGTRTFPYHHTSEYPAFLCSCLFFLS